MKAGVEFVLVKLDTPDSGPQTTDLGILIVTDQELPIVEVEVLSVGNHVSTDEMGVGDIAYCNRFGLQHIKDDIYAIGYKNILAYE